MIEWLEIGPCPGRPGIAVNNSTNTLIRHVRIHGAVTGIATVDSWGTRVDGDVTILNPGGPVPEGQCVQFDKEQGGVIRGVTCRAGATGTHPEDLLSAYMSRDILIEGNDVDGGLDATGCGIIVDDSGLRITIRNNRVRYNVNCGIGIAAGQDIIVEGNLVQRDGSFEACGGFADDGEGLVDNSCVYVWKQYDSPCDNIAFVNNTVVDSKPFWDGGNCTNVTESGNSWQ